MVNQRKEQKYLHEQTIIISQEQQLLLQEFHKKKHGNEVDNNLCVLSFLLPVVGIGIRGPTFECSQCEDNTKMGVQVVFCPTYLMTRQIYGHQHHFPVQLHFIFLPYIQVAWLFYYCIFGPRVPTKKSPYNLFDQPLHI